MVSAPTLFDYEPEGFVRHDDPRPAKDAAASGREAKAKQRRKIVEYLASHDRACADDLAPIIGKHRTVASTRLNVVGSKGHAEKCGLYPAADADGHVRDVEHWRITNAGREWLTKLREADRG